MPFIIPSLTLSMGVKIEKKYKIDKYTIIYSITQNHLKNSIIKILWIFVRIFAIQSLYEWKEKHMIFAACRSRLKLQHIPSSSSA